MKCSCNYVQYCSTRCQEEDKEEHSEECFYIKKRKSPPPSDTARQIHNHAFKTTSQQFNQNLLSRFLLRLLLKMRRGGEKIADLVPGQVRSN